MMREKMTDAVVPCPSSADRDGVSGRNQRVLEQVLEQCAIYAGDLFLDMTRRCGQGHERKRIWSQARSRCR